VSIATAIAEAIIITAVPVMAISIAMAIMIIISAIIKN
jgi:hypothetical protein